MGGAGGKIMWGPWAIVSTPHFILSEMGALGAFERRRDNLVQFLQDPSGCQGRMDCGGPGWRQREEAVLMTLAEQRGG